MLSLLNVYDWKGNNPIPPELWLLPKILPIYPGNLWCHTRMVYLPMSFLYGTRYQAPVDDLILSLREELFITPFEKINWTNARTSVSKVDLYNPTSSLMNVLNGTKC